MTALASILTMNTLKKSNNFTYIIVGLIVCVAIYFFKDLSLALGQTNRISLSLAAWVVANRSESFWRETMRENEFW